MAQKKSATEAARRISGVIGPLDDQQHAAERHADGDKKTTLTSLIINVRLADVEHDDQRDGQKGICRVINRVMSTAQLSVRRSV
jgi:hypothetical protein